MKLVRSKLGGWWTPTRRRSRPGVRRSMRFGVKPRTIFGPGAKEHYLPVIQKIMAEGVPFAFEDYFPNLDKHFRFTSVPLGDHFITTVADITSVKKAVDALREASAACAHSATRSPAARFTNMCVGRMGGVLCLCQRRYRETLGLSAERVMADPDALRQLIVAEDRPRLAAAEEQSARSFTPFDCEFRQRTITGEVKWVQCRSTPRRLEDGSVLWDGIVMDITDASARRAYRQADTALAVLSRVNETIVRARMRKSCSEVCGIIAEIGDFPLVWIGAVRGRQVVPVASAGPAAEYLAGNSNRDRQPAGHGTGRDVHSRGSDGRQQAFFWQSAGRSLRAAALRFGFLASAAFPLRRGGKPVAELPLYGREAVRFDVEQVALLESLSADLSYAASMRAWTM